MRAEARRQQRLVRVAHRRVGQQHRFCSSIHAAKRSAPSSSSFCFVPGGGGGADRASQLRIRQPRRARPALHFIVAVDDDLADEIQQPRRAIALAREAEQLGRLVDELRGVVRAGEARMHDQLIEKAQVRRHAAHAEFPQRAMHARDRVLRRRRPRRDLHEQRIIRRCDDRAGVCGAGVEPDAEAGRAAIRGDAAVVGMKLFSGSSEVTRHCIAKPLRRMSS